MFKEISRVGTRHFEGNIENQDVLCHGENDNFRVISLADGVSTCKKAKRGAEIASRELTRLLLGKGDYFLESEEDKAAGMILSHIFYELRFNAKEEDHEVDDYSSTLSGVVLDKKSKKILCFNLGDGIIIAVQNDKCRVLAMPSDSTFGCCVTTTEDAKDMITVKTVAADEMESILICSDGAWDIIYDKGKLKPEVEEWIVNGNFGDLDNFMIGQNCRDDYSFISMNI